MKKRMTLKVALMLALVSLVVLAAGLVNANSKKAEIPEYIGSQACLGCHAEKFAAWKTSDHAHMVVEIINSSELPADIATAPAELQAELQKATHLVAGTRFMARDAATQQYKFLGVTYDPVTHKYNKANPGSNWSTGCAGCHTTDMNTKAGTWNELGIGCEACHGPARDHAINKGDTSKITVSKSADVCGQCHGGADRATGGNLMTDGTKWVVGYRPGMKLEDIKGLNMTKVDPSKLPPDPNKNHLRIYGMWAASGHGQANKSLLNSSYASAECFTCHTAEGIAAKAEGTEVDPAHKASFNPITCVSCHDPHQSENHYQLKMEPEALCASCHANHDVTPTKPAAAGKPVYESNEAALKGYGAIGIKQTESFHSDISCVECHMVEGNHLMKVIRPDAEGLDAARVDACTQCHTDSDKEVRGAYLQEWQAAFERRNTPLQADMKVIADALKANPQVLSAELKAKYDVALTNLSIINNDGSRGAHNFEYAMKILSQAKKDIDAVKAGLK
ncbi:MAG TPA: ammonia-forming cytochrome c nitrite reductase subunit c552 [Symbiobacteriaceae bacterium]|nr:ammonia-forming cytochrome c nitrite reductase subunit c552 [Symbiobacteriaceae bacterium]